MIYADYAATSATHPKCVIDAVVETLRCSGNPGRGAHEETLKAGRIVLHARQQVASFFGVDDFRHVVFTSGITESLNTVVRGMLTEQDHVITTWAEHNSVLRPLYEKEKQGMELTITNPDVYEIEKQIKHNTKMVIMTHGSNVTGDIYDIRSVGEICKKYGILLVLDSAQTAGVYPVSMRDDMIDILCFAGHKGLLGPQGIGGICIRKDLQIHPLKTGGTGIDSFSKEQPKNYPEALEAGTLNLPGIAGLAAGISYLNRTNIETIRKKEVSLAKRFYDGIKNLQGIRLYGDFRDFTKRSAIVSLNIGDYSSQRVSDELQQRFGIMTRSGAHCAPLVHKHFQTVDQGMVRFSFGYETTDVEVNQCIEAIKILVEE